ncbi:MAG: homocysteine S-methyltransferase family protein [Gemmatimonadetes bacterium]|nr:homocysteine S-methyltransferase family protein [Gemmatimonadota bacterium]
MSHTANAFHLPVRSGYLDALARGVLVYDGAMGTNIQRYHLTAEDYGGKSLEGCNDHLVLTRPDVIQSIHESFPWRWGAMWSRRAPSSRPRGGWRSGGSRDKVQAINVAAARWRARRATRTRRRSAALRRGVDRAHGDAAVEQRPALSNVTFEALSEDLLHAGEVPDRGRVDVLLVETSQDILEVKAALAGFARLFRELGYRIPVQAQITLDTSGRMLLGTDIASAMTTLESLGADVIGLNCSTGPEHMREPVRYLSQHATRPVSVIPNAGLPLNTGTGDAVYPLEPAAMAEMLGEFVRDFGVRIVGVLRDDAGAPAGDLCGGGRVGGAGGSGR